MYKWSITIGIVLGTICIAAFAFLYKLPTVYKYENESMKTETHKMSTHFVENSTYNSEDTHPFLKTGFENKFYSADENGKISFYEFDGKSFKKVRESKSLDITLPGADEKKPVNVSLLTVDGKTEGYGVYSDKESTTYPYAFLKIVENRITDNYDYIVFVDHTIQDFYKNSKTYNDAFVYSSSAKKAKHIFPGTDSETSILLPTEFICERNDGFYFFASSSDKTSTDYKLYLKKSVNGKETLISDNIALPYVFTKDEKVCFFKNVLKTDNSEHTSFELVELGNENKPLHVFTGTPTEYIVNGKYILNPNAKTVYSIERNEVQNIGSAFTILSVDTFAISNDGQKMAMAGTFAGNREKLLAYDFSQDELKVYNGEGLLLTGNTNITMIDDCVYFLAPAETSSKVRNYVINWSDLI